VDTSKIPALLDLFKFAHSEKFIPSSWPVVIGRSLGRDWRRRPGRPRARWTDQLRNDTGSVPANLWRQAILQATGPWWSDATARAGYAMTTILRRPPKWWMLSTDDAWEVYWAYRGQTRHQRGSDDKIWSRGIAGHSGKKEKMTYCTHTAFTINKTS